MPKFASQIDAMKIPLKGLVVEASSTAPTSPVNGQLWYDTTAQKFKGFQNGVWIILDLNTTYTAATDTDATAGTNTANQLWAASRIKLAVQTHAPVKSVAGRSGAVTLAVADIGGLSTALDGKAAASHSHTIAQVTGLQTALDGKAPTLHAHDISSITGLQTALDGKAAASHAHAIADVTGLSAALNAKATPADITAAINAVVDGAPGAIDTLNELAAALGDDPNFATTMTNALAGKAASNHGHGLADATIGGVLPVAKGGTGGTTALAARAGIAAVGHERIAIAHGITAGTWHSYSHSLGMTLAVNFYEVATNEQIHLDVKVSTGSVQYRSDVAFAPNTIAIAIIGV